VMKLPDEPTLLERLITLVTDMTDDSLVQAHRRAEEASTEGHLRYAILLITIINMVLEAREHWYRDIGWRPGDPHIFPLDEDAP
jgi:hypothetical protein